MARGRTEFAELEKWLALAAAAVDILPKNWQKTLGAPGALAWFLKAL